jgi:hypothetical protein
LTCIKILILSEILSKLWGMPLKQRGKVTPHLRSLEMKSSHRHSTVLAGLVWNVDEVSEEKLVITGNWIQALGGAVAGR